MQVHSGPCFCIGILLYFCIKCLITECSNSKLGICLPTIFFCFANVDAPRNVNISQNTEVKIGESFMLSCRAEGNPKPTVLWRRLRQDGHLVVAGEGDTLLVKEVSWSNDGEYECEMCNTAGNLTAHVTVIVQGELNKQTNNIPQFKSPSLFPPF